MAGQAAFQQAARPLQLPGVIANAAFDNQLQDIAAGDFSAKRRRCWRRVPSPCTSSFRIRPGWSAPSTIPARASTRSGLSGRLPRLAVRLAS